MSAPGSISELIIRIKSGDAAAARTLWELFAPRLLALARKKLADRSLGIADEEDVVQSALAGFFQGVELDQFHKLNDRDDLWQILALITCRKAINLVLREASQKRSPGQRAHDLRAATASDPASAGGLAPGRARLEDLEQALDPHPSPDMALLLNESSQAMLARLGDVQLRAIAVWKLEGYSNDEIAAMLGRTRRCVERKLRLIRTIWHKDEPS
jgi:RNA polymerase sigma factor (sigma-70 family)